MRAIVDVAITVVIAIAITAVVLLAASGLANAYTRLGGLDQFFTTGYGNAILIKIGLIVGLAFLGLQMRRRILPSLDIASRTRGFVRIAVSELVIMATAIGLGVSLASSPYPREEEVFPSYGESLLGFAYPPPPTIESVALGFRVDPLFFTASLLAADLYVI